MNTLDTDTLIVIEPQAQNNAENTVETNTQNVTTTSVETPSKPENKVEVATTHQGLPESAPVQEQIAIDDKPKSQTQTQADESPETAQPTDITHNSIMVETTAVQPTHKQQAEPELSVVENISESSAQLVLTPDTDTNPQTQPDTETGNLQTIAHTPIYQPTMLLSGAEWLVLSIVLFTTVVVLISNRKTVNKVDTLSQTKTVHQHISDTDTEFEKARMVAKNRQQWIHSFRDEIANFVAATNAIWDLHKIKDGCEDILTDMKDPQFVMKELYHWSCTYNKAMQETEKLYAKIHLLINPKEETSQQLSSLLDKTMVAIEAKKSPSKLNDELIACSQKILKAEWERVKTFS